MRFSARTVIYIFLVLLAMVMGIYLILTFAKLNSQTKNSSNVTVIPTQLTEDKCISWEKLSDVDVGKNRCVIGKVQFIYQGEGVYYLELKSLENHLFHVNAYVPPNPHMGHWKGFNLSYPALKIGNCVGIAGQVHYFSDTSNSNQDSLGLVLRDSGNVIEVKNCTY